MDDDEPSAAGDVALVEHVDDVNPCGQRAGIVAQMENMARTQIHLLVVGQVRTIRNGTPVRQGQVRPQSGTDQEVGAESRMAPEI